MHPWTHWNNYVSSIERKDVACEYVYEYAYYNIIYKSKRKSTTSVLGMVMVKYVMVIYVMECDSAIRIDLYYVY